MCLSLFLLFSLSLCSSHPFQSLHCCLSLSLSNLPCTLVSPPPSILFSSFSFMSFICIFISHSFPISLCIPSIPSVFQCADLGMGSTRDSALLLLFSLVLWLLSPRSVVSSVTSNPPSPFDPRFLPPPPPMPMLSPPLFLGFSKLHLPQSTKPLTGLALTGRRHFSMVPRRQMPSDFMTPVIDPDKYLPSSVPKSVWDDDASVTALSFVAFNSEGHNPHFTNLTTVTSRTARENIASKRNATLRLAKVNSQDDSIVDPKQDGHILLSHQKTVETEDHETPHELPFTASSSGNVLSVDHNVNATEVITAPDSFLSLPPAASEERGTEVPGVEQSSNQSRDSNQTTFKDSFQHPSSLYTEDTINEGLSDAVPLIPPFVLTEVPTTNDTTKLSSNLRHDNISELASKEIKDRQVIGARVEHADILSATTAPFLSWPEPVPCWVSRVNEEGFVTFPVSPSTVPTPPGPPKPVHCMSTLSTYPGLGLELQLKSLHLFPDEELLVEGLGPGSKVTALANQTLLVEGQVVRSFTNQMLVRFRSRRPHHHGSFRFHFQEYRLHCPFPARPTHGRVRVRDPSVGGRALYSCQPGYVLPDDNQYATCLNGTQPAWSQPLPQCHAPCGGIFSTATGGRILSPGYPDGYNGNLSCIWFLTAPPGQRLHVHFERVSLAEDDDRLIISDGSMPTSPLLYDSFRAEFPPGEGLTSSAHSLTIQLYTDGTGNAAGFALRYESFGPGHCYEPYIRFGRFQASDPAFSVGSMVSFSCDPGYSLDQGPSLLYCQDGRGPTWNDTEPLCRALCGGEVTDTEGLVLSPHWPEMYDEGQDCVWGVHAAQGTYLELQLHTLVVRASDMLTVYDGEDLSAPVLAQLSGQYHGVHLTSSQPDITLQFQSDPSPHGLGLGFRISFTERMRNDSCPDLPKVSNGWRTPSGNRLPYGASVSYHCYPSYDIEGPEIISCLWDLSWSEPPPSCQKALYCSDPGNVVNAERHVSDPDFPLGSTVRYICASGQILVGSSRLTCRGRVSGPQWSSPPPHCQAVSRACPDPGFPHGGSRHPQEVQRFRGNDIVYFACPVGFHLIGPSILSCLSSYPPSWNGTLPNCKANDGYFLRHQLDAQEATPTVVGKVAPALLILIIVVMHLVVGIYLFLGRCHHRRLNSTPRGSSSWCLPLITPSNYAQVAMETTYENPAFDNGGIAGLYFTGIWQKDLREYEVCI